MRVKRLNHCAYLLSYHLVLVTKYRRQCLSAAMLGEPRTVPHEQLVGKGGALLEFNGEADHLHLLMELPPTQALSSVVNSLKTVSSRLLRKWHRAELARHFKGPVLWSRSYFVSTVGSANLETVKRYIEQQERPQ